MLKYLNTAVTFREIPDEVSLCINITNCPNHCSGCHSLELWEDKGTILTEDTIDGLIEQNFGISCVCLMGGDQEPALILKLGKVIRQNGLKAAWYSGKENLAITEMLEVFNYIKLGRFVEMLGGLDSPNTNQRLYKIFSPNHIKQYSFQERTWNDIEEFKY